MLDSLLGNVFGRSKKDKNSSNNNNQIGPNGETPEGFVVVGQQQQQPEGSDDQNSLYPRVTTMLTQEMIVGQTSTGGGAHQMAGAIIQRTTSQSYSSPIDNIPFSPLMGGGQQFMDNHSLPDRCLGTIDRIQQYLYTESQSQYSFHLENTILSESLLS